MISARLTISRYYYQYAEDRLSTCVLTLHALLHVPNDIRFCGPGWTTWTFFMERFCGFLKRSLSCKRYPWSNLNNRILNLAYLEQLAVRYDLDEELVTLKSVKKERKYDVTYPSCAAFPTFSTFL